MDGQVENPVAQGDPATEPIDLAQAFKMYNQINRTPAQKPVGDDGGSEEAGGVESAGAEPAADGEQGAPSGEEQVDGSSGGEVGTGSDGSADVVEPIDYNPAKQQIMKDVQREALSNVRKRFQEQQIEMWSIEDLYERDEQTGRVRFRNPDNPDRDFQSRFEAQQFVDAMNKQITASFRQEVNKEQSRLMQEQAPKMRLLDFAPRYYAMDQTTKDIFEELITPYAIKDSKGDDIGFNVNLEAVARQAESIAKRFAAHGEQAQQAEQKQQDEKKSSGPALDMKTGVSRSGDVEPKTIGEALKMYDAQKRKGK